MSPKQLTFPPSKATVRVRMLDTTAVMTVRAQSFVEPVQPGHEMLNLTAVAFLIEHGSQKIMFDLGVRKDYWNYSDVINKRIGDVIPGLRVEKDVSDVLVDGGIDIDGGDICKLCL